MDAYLTTERIVLRPFTPEDVDLLVELDSDPDVMRFLTDGRPATPEEVAGYFPRILELYEKTPGFGFWAAFERETGAFAGWFLFRLGPNPEDGAELGYRLRRESWGKGYATEVSRALVRKGFEELGLRRVYALAMAGHEASRHVMEKAGLRYESDYLEDKWPGDDKRAVVYALTRDELP